MKTKNLFYLLQLLDKQQRYLINCEQKQHNDYNASELELCRHTVAEVSIEYSKGIQKDFGFDKDNA